MALRPPSPLSAPGFSLCCFGEPAALLRRPRQGMNDLRAHPTGPSQDAAHTRTGPATSSGKELQVGKRPWGLLNHTVKAATSPSGAQDLPPLPLSAFCGLSKKIQSIIFPGVCSFSG